jgi:subtilisin-like proprotein convertase family protein
MTVVTVRHRWTAALLASTLLTTLVVTAGPSPAAAVEGGQPAILQLGDSYASGEGGGWKGNSNTSSGNRSGTDMAAYQENGKWKYDPHLVYNDASYYNHEDSWRDNCHESLHAPIRSLSNTHPDDFLMLYNFACSGAHNKNLWRFENGGEAYNTRAPQIHHLAHAVVPGHDVDLVAISAGGNDSGFGEAVRACLTAWGKRYLVAPFTGSFDEMCRDDIRVDIMPRISDMYYNLAKTVDLVRAQLASDGQPADSYRLVLQGYPLILPTATDDWSYAEDTLGNHCYVNRDDAEWINTFFVPRLNRMVRAVADEKGVGFIDPSEAFVGHRLCEYGTVRGSEAAASSSRAEWVRFVDVHVSTGGVLWDIIKKIAPPDGHWPLYDDEIADMLNSQRHVSESFHPNYWGQQALGRCLKLYYHLTTGAAKVRCFNRGGQAGTTDQMSLDGLPLTPTHVDNPSPDLQFPANGILQREIILPDSLPIGSHLQPYLDLEHPRKGQLQIALSHPATGTIRTLRKANLSDTGAWTDGRWTVDYNHSVRWPPPPPNDPSGRWLLTITDTVDDQYKGTFRAFDMRIY